MTQDEFIDVIHPVLRDAGSTFDSGEEFQAPPLDLLRYYRRPVRLSRLPLLGTGSSVVVVARQPIDIEGSKSGYLQLLERIAMAANGRYPPWKGLALGLTALVLTPEPILPTDDAMLGQVLENRPKRIRAVPFGLIRVNLGQEAMALALSGSDNLFPEPSQLADALCVHFRRFVPPIIL